jgi:hypothetical protein
MPENIRGTLALHYSNYTHTLVYMIFLYYVCAICILKHAGTFALKNFIRVVVITSNL